jgi:hypothetical protein
MRLHVVQTADSGDLAALRDAPRDGRAAAMSRRRALAAGRSALAPAYERVGTGFREAELRAPEAAVDATPPARLGRALSMQRRRQLSQGKQALNGGGDRTAAAAGSGAPVFIVHAGGGR